TRLRTRSRRLGLVDGLRLMVAGNSFDLPSLRPAPSRAGSRRLRSACPRGPSLRPRGSGEDAVGVGQGPAGHAFRLLLRGLGAGDRDRREVAAAAEDDVPGAGAGVAADGG